MSFLSAGAAALTLVVLGAAPATAAAQGGRSDRPFRGLFGASSEIPEDGQSVTLDWGLLGGYDDNLAADTTSTSIDPSVVVNGPYGSANGTLNYLARNQQRSFGATATTSGRYYPTLSDLSAFDGGGGLTFTSDLGRRTKVDLAQSFAYRPYYGIDLANTAPSGAPAVEVGVPPDLNALSPRSSVALDGRAGVTRTLGVRSSLRADYSYRSQNFSGGDETFSWRLGQVSFVQNVTRYAALRVGYGYGVGKNTVAGALPKTVNHNLDLGIDYGRQVSFSRRTRINFSSGSTGVVAGGTTTFRLIGTAGVTQDIGRSWRAEGSYQRSVQYVPGFGQNFFAGITQGRIAGQLRRRIEASFSGSHSSGEVGADRAGDSSYSSATAAADLRVAMSRTLSVFAQYTYYRYGFDNGVQVPFGLPPQLDRQAVRIGISGWLPFVR